MHKTTVLSRHMRHGSPALELHSVFNASSLGEWPPYFAPQVGVGENRPPSGRLTMSPKSSMAAARQSWSKCPWRAGPVMGLENGQSHESQRVAADPSHCGAARE